MSRGKDEELRIGLCQGFTSTSHQIEFSGGPFMGILKFCRLSSSKGAVLPVWGLALGAIFAISPVVAQSSSSSGEEVEEVVILGSKIKRARRDGVSPISSFERSDILLTGAESIGSFLQGLPGQGSAINSTYNNGGDGSTRVALRNLTPPRTLVLVNGRRWVNSGTGADASVDLTTIPIAMVERIDVLRDGASAIYGSDAIAGVINITTREDFQGLDWSARDGEYTAGGGRYQRYDMVLGSPFTDDKGSVVVGLSYEREYGLRNDQRPEASAPPSFRGSSGTPQGSFTYSAPTFATNHDVTDPDGVTSVRRQEEQYLITLTRTFDGDTMTPSQAVKNDAITTTRALINTGTNDNPVYVQALYDGDGQPAEVRTVTVSGTPEVYDNARWFALELLERGQLTAMEGFTVMRQFSDGTPRLVDTSLRTPGNSRDETAGTIRRNAFGIVVRRNPILVETKTNAAGESQAVNDLFGDAQTPSGSSCSGFTVNEGTAGGYSYDSDTLLTGALTSNFRCFDSSTTSATTSDRFNYNPYNFIRTPNERRSIFATVEYDVWEDHNLRTDVSYQKRTSSQLLAPTPLFWGTSPRSVAQRIDYTNIYNPFDVQFCAAVDSTSDCAHPDDLSPEGVLIPQPEKTVYGGFGRRLLEVGNRFYEQEIDTFRAAFNLAGDIPFKDWTYEAFWQWGQNDALFRRNGLVNTQRVSQALGPAADCQDPCVPLNVFGGQGIDSAKDQATQLWTGSGSITQEMIDYITFVGQESGGNTLRYWGADITGTVFTINDNPASVAFGYENRAVTGYYQPDSIVTAGITSGNISQPTGGGYSSDEFFGELDLLVVDTEELLVEGQVAFRSAEYTNFGSATTTKFGGIVGLGDKLKFRTNFAEGFRAPSVGNLFAGQSDNFPSVRDPCSFDTSTSSSNNFTGNRETGVHAGQCAAENVPVGYVQLNTQIRTTVGGNPDLQPEESESTTYGVVWTPRPGFHIAVDLFDISITNALDSIGESLLLNGCYIPGTVSPAMQGQFCSQIQRSSTGEIVSLTDLTVNIGGYDTSGIEIFVDIEDIETSFGSFDIHFDLYSMSSYELTQADGTVANVKGFVLGSEQDNYADMRFRLFADWNFNRWDGRLSLRHIAAATGAGSLASLSNPMAVFTPLEAENYIDVVVGYTFPNLLGNGKNVRVSATVQNLLDNDPTLFRDTFANDFNPDYEPWAPQLLYFTVSGSL